MRWPSNSTQYLSGWTKNFSNLLVSIAYNLLLELLTCLRGIKFIKSISLLLLLLFLFFLVKLLSLNIYPNHTFFICLFQHSIELLFYKVKCSNQRSPTVPFWYLWKLQLKVISLDVITWFECELSGESELYWMFLPGTSIVVTVSGVSRKSTFPLWKVLL